LTEDHAPPVRRRGRPFTRKLTRCSRGSSRGFEAPEELASNAAQRRKFGEKIDRRDTSSMLLIAAGLALALIAADLYDLAFRRGARRVSGTSDLGVARNPFLPSAQLGEGEGARLRR
jgi:hypothetical protein